MIKKFKGLLSILLVILTVFTIGLPIASAVPGYENDLPVVYVRGAGRPVYNAKGQQILPFKVDPEEKIMEELDRLLAAFASSVLTKNWDTYCDELVEVVSEVYKNVVLDNNGEANDGSYSIASTVPAKKTSDYRLSDYVFNYDPRLDPWSVAADLNAYINKVLSVTGKKKVQLVGRCLGGNYVSAYLTRYGGSKIESVIFYVASTKGTVLCSESFSGNFRFDPDLINDYMKNASNESDSDMMGFLKSLVSVTHSLSILSTGTELVQSVYNQISADVVPRLLLATYATMPGYWSMVDDEHYEEAKRLVFGNNTSEYAKLIQKIDNYHYNVMNAFDSTMKKLQREGVKIAVIAKYNTALPPIFQSSEKQSDGTIELSNLSFGATAANFGKTLSKAYIEEVKSNGLINYISDDLIIDSSTCLFPDSTWFIKNSEHGHFPTAINYLMYEIFGSKKQLTVWDNKKYPQYLAYNSDNTLSIVTEPDKVTDTSSGNKLLDILVSFVQTFINIIKNILGAFLGYA